MLHNEVRDTVLEHHARATNLGVRGVDLAADKTIQRTVTGEQDRGAGLLLNRALAEADEVGCVFREIILYS